MEKVVDLDDEVENKFLDDDGFIWILFCVFFVDWYCILDLFGSGRFNFFIGEGLMIFLIFKRLVLSLWDREIVSNFGKDFDF